jgi:hypothetical protein
VRLKNGERFDVHLLTDFVSRGERYLDPKTVFRSQRCVSHYPRPSVKCELENLMLSYGLQGMVIPDVYQEEIMHRLSWNSSSTIRYLNAKYKLQLESIDEAFNLTPLELEKVKKSFRIENGAIGHAVSLFKYTYDTVVQLFKGGGFICTLSGVDGVERVKVLQDLSRKLETKFRKEVVVLTFRPGILPFLTNLKTKQGQSVRNGISSSRRKSRKSAIGSWGKFLYCLTDYVIGQFYIKFKYSWRGKIVIYDRFYFDFINESGRSNLRLNRAMMKWFYRLLIKPKMNVYLYAKADVKLVGDNNLNRQDASVLNKKFFDLFKEYSNKYKGKYVTIENHNREDAIQQILQELSLVA